MNEIPEMTHPYGKHWQQPRDIREAPMDKTHVLLDRRQFKGLHDYSATIPSGVYDGKCWRRRERREWFLCWYSPSSDPKQCAINMRRIRIGKLKPRRPAYAEH